MAVDSPAQPATSPRGRLFTPANAREMGLRSAAARKQRAQEKPNEPAKPPQALPTTEQTEVVRTARINVESQLQKLDEQLARKLEPKEWDMLTRAKDRLFKAWVHLISLPGPGTLKPSAARSRRQSPASFAPVEPDQPPTNTG